MRKKKTETNNSLEPTIGEARAFSKGAAGLSIYATKILAPLFVILALAATIFFCWFKLGELYSWQYTSDLFCYDLVMREILRGSFFGLDYGYGNQFGDHSLLWIALLAPLKILLGRHMVDFLLIVSPLAYGLSSLLLFKVIQRKAGTLLAFCASTIYLTSFLTVPGLWEQLYGFHFDTISGFLAVLFACILVAREQAMGAEGEAKALTAMFWLSFAAFLTLKEEMALLAIVFFFIVSILRRNRLNLIALVLSLMAFGATMFMIHCFTTPWNRTNHALLSGFLASIKGETSRGWLFQTTALQMYATLTFLVVLFISVILPKGKRNPYAIGLFLMGLAKITTAFMAQDASVHTWHTFPGYVMLVGALALQIGEIGFSGNRFHRWLSCGVIAIMLAANYYVFSSLIKKQVLRARGKQIEMKTVVIPPKAAEERERNLKQVKSLIDRNKVVALYGRNCVIDWTDNYRFSFFPYGILLSPKGIADYLVVDHKIPDPDMASYLDDRINKEFRVVLETPYITLFERKAISREASAQREKFIEYFGPDSIGQKDEKYPIVD